MLRLARRLVTLVGGFLAALAVGLAVPGVFGKLEWVRPDNLLAAFSFAPPSILVIVGGIGAALLALAGKRRVAVATAAILAVHFAAFGDYRIVPLFRGPPAADASSEARLLKVLAYNVQYFREGPEKVAGVVLDSGADVLLLSEMEGTLPRRAAFEVAMNAFDTRISSSLDTAILSRHPIVAYKEVLLPTHQPSLHDFNLIADQQKKPRRSFMHATLDVGGVPVHVLAVRFIAGRGASHGLVDQIVWGKFLLKEQAREVESFVRYVESLSGPVLFGGDLNAPPSSITIQQLKRVARDAYMEHHAWGTFTFLTKLLPQTKEKHLPAMRLDYLFTAGDLVTRRTAVLKVYASDHFPLYGEFVVPDESPLAAR